LAGFISGADVQALEQYSPWIIRVLSVCALTPACRELAISAAGLAVTGYVAYKAGVQIYQAQGRTNVGDTGIADEGTEVH
jgi:hypothetical protein